MPMQNMDLNAALCALSPDCTREEWVKIAMAYKAAGGDFNTFDTWSQKAPGRYDARNCLDKPAGRLVSLEGPPEASSER